MKNILKHVLAVAALLVLPACGGGSSGGDNGPPVDGKPDSLVFSPGAFTDVTPGEDIVAKAKLAGFDGELTAHAAFEDAHDGEPVLFTKDSSGQRSTIKVKAGDELNLHFVVDPDHVAGGGANHQLAPGDRIVAVVTVGEGDDAVSTKVTAIVADLENPGLAVDFPLDKSVTRAETITVSGRAWDDGEIDSVRVNGQPAVLEADGNGWSAIGVPLNSGSNPMTVEVKDKTGKLATQTLDLFRYNGEFGGLQTAYEAGYFGDEESFLIDLPDSNVATVVRDEMTGKLYFPENAGPEFQVVELDPVSGSRRIVFGEGDISNGPSLSAGYPFVVHNGTAYFYTVDEAEADNGIYQANLADCGLADADPATTCLAPFVTNGEDAVDAGERLFVENSGGVFVSDDQLWVFNTTDEDSNFLKFDLNNGALISVPVAFDGAVEPTLSVDGTTAFYSRGLGDLFSIDLASVEPNASEAHVSGCGALTTSPDCASDPVTFPGAVGAGPAIRRFSDNHFAGVLNGRFVSLVQSDAENAGDPTFRPAIFSFDLETGDRHFLIGQTPGDGIETYYGEPMGILDIRDKVIVGDKARRAFYWNGDALYLINFATVIDPETGESRFSLESVLLTLNGA